MTRPFVLYVHKACQFETLIRTSMCVIGYFKLLYRIWQKRRRRRRKGSRNMW